MPDTTKGPKIRVFLKTGQRAEPDAPMLRFVRMKLVPLPARAVEPEVQEDEGQTEPLGSTGRSARRRSP